MSPIEDIKPLLETSRKVVITMHQKPDADAMGASLALYLYLLKKGHQVTVISPTNFPAFLKWMPGCDQVLNFENGEQKAVKILSVAEILFCLDFNALNRTKNMAPYLEKLRCTKVLIDHHPLPENSFDFAVSDITASSSAQLVYELIIKFGDESLIDIPTAECLYAGSMTDTGSFRFASTTSRVHRMVANLMDIGLMHEPIHQAIYDNYLENRLRFIGNALLNRMELFYEYNTALIAIPQTDVRRYDLQTGDTEGVVNLPFSIQGIRFSTLIIDRDSEIKLSFRSKGNFDVNAFARKYFSGGGHQNAAGGRSTDTLEKTVTRFQIALSENKNLLN